MGIAPGARRLARSAVEWLGWLGRLRERVQQEHTQLRCCLRISRTGAARKDVSVLESSRADGVNTTARASNLARPGRVHVLPDRVVLPAVPVLPVVFRPGSARHVRAEVNTQPFRRVNLAA
ncbi:MAG: hypothetical protein H7210_09335 [Pyrinomonadaceae bacterium]|nr:hypothetical protein [Phycisphaerales bacterium]